MNTLSVNSFFYDWFSLRMPEVKTVVLTGETAGKPLQINAFNLNNIYVESCSRNFEAAFCAYQSV